MTGIVSQSAGRTQGAMVLVALGAGTMGTLNLFFRNALDTFRASSGPAFCPYLMLMLML